MRFSDNTVILSYARAYAVWVMLLVDKFWFVLMAAGIVFAAIDRNMGALNDALYQAAQDVPQLILGLCGMICLWTGLMKIAERSGMVRGLGRLLSPLVRRLFPDIPRDDPAFFAILMNFSANLLGIGNAATPFGLKAMDRLQQLNPDKTAASPDMITFLVLNTSCMTLMPTTVMALRSAAGSADPGVIILPTVIASGLGLCCGLLLDRLCRIIGRRRL